MTRKHYIAIARVIKDNTIDEKSKRFNASRFYKYSLIDDLSKVFARDNGLFSKDRFVDACIDE